MAQRQVQIPDIDLSKPETLLIRIAFLRNAVRQLDDELTGIVVEMQRQMKMAQDQARAAQEAAMPRPEKEAKLK